MRFLIASMMLCFCTVCYSQETTESPAEVTKADDVDVTAEVDSLMVDNGCGCGQGGSNKDKKPNI